MLKQGHSPHAGSLNVLARGSGAYMSPRTPVLPPKRVATEEEFAREREMSATPTISSADADFDEFTVKMLKEKKALKVEILQAVSSSFHYMSLAGYMRDFFHPCTP